LAGTLRASNLAIAAIEISESSRASDIFSSTDTDGSDIREIFLTGCFVDEIDDECPHDKNPVV
jgi:hypothetical protein